MFNENDNDDGIDIINFDEYANNVLYFSYLQAISPKNEIEDQRPSSPPKIIKNQQFHKNLGQNQAYYQDDKKFDIN